MTEEEFDDGLRRSAFAIASERRFISTTSRNTPVATCAPVRAGRGSDDHIGFAEVHSLAAKPVDELERPCPPAMPPPESTSARVVVVEEVIAEGFWTIECPGSGRLSRWRQR